MKNFTAGRRVKSIAEFDKILEKGSLIYIHPWKNPVNHPIILANMPYRVVKKFIEQTGVYYAKKIKRK